MQERQNSIANALELCLSCIKPSLHLYPALTAVLQVIAIYPKGRPNIFYKVKNMTVDALAPGHHVFSYLMSAPNKNTSKFWQVI